MITNLNTNFHIDKIPKQVCQCICLSVVLIDTVFRTGKNYFPQVHLEESKCVVKEKQMPDYIIIDIDIFSGDSYEENSDEESSNEGTSNEEN